MLSELFDDKYKNMMVGEVCDVTVEPGERARAFQSLSCAFHCAFTSPKMSPVALSL